MTQKEQDYLLSALDGKDVSEVLMQLMQSGNRYSRRILRVSDATLNRMVQRGDLPNGECKKRGHTRYWKKWDILWFLKKKHNV